MKISSVANLFHKSNLNTKKSNDRSFSFQVKENCSTDVFVSNSKQPSFKGIFLEDMICLGRVSADKHRSKFQKKDALLLQEIASLYPNQDCFIMAGKDSLPCIAYREKPIALQKFTRNIVGQNAISIDPEDSEYPIIPLIIYPDEPDIDLRRKNLSLIFGVPSYISINPSLPYTVKVGYELHKQLLEKKYQILKVVGQNEHIDLGTSSIAEKAHESIECVENAVTRYLLESAYEALTDRVTAGQLYASNYTKVQNTLQNKRDIDLTTPLSKQYQELKNPYEVDICEKALETYPDDEENKDEIIKLVDYMLENNIYLYCVEGIDTGENY